MTYSLHRESDGAGDTGPMSLALKDTEIIYDARPTVGYHMRVGSSYARTYSSQDYWTTTPVIEIIEDTPNRVYFRTRNSVYVWTKS
jgi:hypothetical protein